MSKNFIHYFQKKETFNEITLCYKELRTFTERHGEDTKKHRVLK
jgi:hypothetical protein